MPMAEKDPGLKDNELVAKINNEIDRELTKYNKAAISYLLNLPKKKELRLFDVYSAAKKKYGLEETRKKLRFIVMVMKLSCCPPPLIQKLVKLDPSLKQTKKPFQLPKECLEDYGDDEDARQDLELKFKMRAVLISLDNILQSHEHGKIFMEYLCEKAEMPPEFDTNFEVFEKLENRSEIGPNRLEFIRERLSLDENLSYALSHFGMLILYVLSITAP